MTKPKEPLMEPLPLRPFAMRELLEKRERSGVSMTHPRNPKLEVHEAALVFLHFSNEKIVSCLIRRINTNDLTIEIITKMIRRNMTNDQAKKQLHLPAFQPMNTAYDERLIQEWARFLKALACFNQHQL